MNNSAEDQASIEHIIQQKDTEGIGAPFLNISIPDTWETGDYSKPAKVTGHDGRHRMAAILKSEGDDPVETHLFPAYLRHRDFEANPEWVSQLNSKIIGQRGNTIQGPFFQETGMNEALVSYLNTMEELSGDRQSTKTHSYTRRKAAEYMGKDENEITNPTDLRRLRAKANKIKRSDSKANRQKSIQISKQVREYSNNHK